MDARPDKEPSETRVRQVLRIWATGIAFGLTGDGIYGTVVLHGLWRVVFAVGAAVAGGLTLAFWRARPEGRAS